MVIERVASLARPGWVGIDGCGAAGKTRLASQIAAAVPDVSVVHVDDFSGPRIPEWDWSRFDGQVVRPLLAGRPARYQRWDWDADAGAEWHEIAPGGLVIVEGVSATRREVRVPWSLTIWVEAPREVRLARARERDGEAMLTRWLEDWMPSEERYIARENPKARADLIVSSVP